MVQPPLISSLEEVGTETEGGLLQLDIARVKTVMSLRAKERRMQERQVRYPEFDSSHVFCQHTLKADNSQREVTEKNNFLTQKDGLLAEKDTKLVRQQEVCTSII